MEETSTNNDQTQGTDRLMASGIGLLGLLLLALGWYFPVYNGELHPSVVAKAAQRNDSARESIVQFGQRLGDQKSLPYNPEAAHIVKLAAAKVDHADAEDLDGTSALDEMAMKYWLLESRRKKLRDENERRIQLATDPESRKRLEDVQLVMDLPKILPILKEELLDPAVMLSAWMHQNSIINESLANDLLTRTRNENIPGLRRFFRAIGTLGDLLNNHQLQELMKVVPDIGTLENIAHIAMVQAKLPYMQGIGNNDEKIVKDELTEERDKPILDHFADFDTNNDGTINMEEWILKGYMPLEACNFPLTYTAVIWAANQPGTAVDPVAAKRVVAYLMKHGMRGDEYLREAMKHGYGSLEFMVQRGEPISQRRGAVMETLATFSLRSKTLATIIRYTLMILGVLLLVRCWNMLAPVVLSSKRAVPYHRWSRHAVAASIMFLIMMASEPAIFSTAQASEYEVAVKIPIAEDTAVDDSGANQNLNQPKAMIAAWENSDIVKNVVMTLIFLAIQIAVYFACIRKIREIEEDDVATPRDKITLLENEDNLFDMGLYIGIAGTALGLALIMVDFFDKPVAAYASNVFGILCVAVVKIWHVRTVKQKLLIQCRETKDATAEA